MGPGKAFTKVFGTTLANIFRRTILFVSFPAVWFIYIDKGIIAVLNPVAAIPFAKDNPSLMAPFPKYNPSLAKPVPIRESKFIYSVNR
jgi:hypothetical protein